MTRIIILAFVLFAYALSAAGQAATTQDSTTPGSANQESANQESANQESANQATLAPGFALKDLRGRSVRLDGHKGKVLLINFWATWCAPCLAEMPDLIKLQKEYGSRGLQIIGVTYPPESRARVLRLARRLKINYTILFGTDKTAADYDVGDVLPTTIVVDREGNVRARILGMLEAEEFDEKVKPLLNPVSAGR
jgi:thiol-disulfide isomerase/thioredoxin